MVFTWLFNLLDSTPYTHLFMILLIVYFIKCIRLRDEDEIYLNSAVLFKNLNVKHQINLNCNRNINSKVVVKV